MWRFPDKEDKKILRVGGLCRKFITFCTIFSLISFTRRKKWKKKENGENRSFSRYVFIIFATSIHSLFSELLPLGIQASFLIVEKYFVSSVATCSYESGLAAILMMKFYDYMSFCWRSLSRIFFLQNVSFEITSDFLLRIV